MSTSRPPDRDAVLAQLERVLSSPGFRDAERSRAMLRFLVERTLDGQGERLKEYTVGAEALNRGVAFDPRTDPIVRAEASRLRTRLDRYYATDGRSDAVVIGLPRGTYVPKFEARVAPERSRVRLRPVAWGLGGSFATVAAFAIGAWVARPAATTSSPRLVTLDVHLQSNGIVGSEVGTDVAIAADASRIVYVATDSMGHTRLHLRAFDGSTATALPGTDGARGPFLSPDGHWVGFWAGGHLKKTSLDGGSPVILCAATDLLGASWGEDGTIVAAFGGTGELSRVSSAGGAPATVLDLAPGRARPQWPQILPGGKLVLYTAVIPYDADRSTIEVASLVDGRRTTLIKGGTYGRFVAPGYLMYVNQGTLYAVRIDLDRLTPRAAAVPIVDDVAYSSTFGFAQAAFSTNGVMAYRRAPGQGRVIVVLRDSAGRDTPLIETPGRYTWPALSPDGRRLALSSTESGVPSTSIFGNLNSQAIRIVPPIADFSAAAWTPDGRFLIGTAPNGLAWLPAAGGTPRSLVDVEVPITAWSFSPDGRLALHQNSPTTALDLWTAAIVTSDSTLRAGASIPLVTSRGYQAYPAYSPDGRWFAYTSNESGPWEIYVRSVSDTSAKVQVSRGGGRVPRWSRGRNELFFATDDQRLMVAKYTVRGGAFIAESPRAWTPGRLAETSVFPNYDIMPDGRRIVALVPVPLGDAAPPPNHVTLMFNFVDELKRRLP